jgi:hypothetical protein
MEALLENVLVIPFIVLTVLAFGAVIRRLLGVRVGPVRTVLGALLAFLLSGPLLYAMLPAPLEADTGTKLVFLTLAVATASLVAMVVLVIAEVLVPEGSLPGPVELWRSSRARLACTRRYLQILRILVRHGLARFLRGQRHSGLILRHFDENSPGRCGGRSMREASLSSNSDNSCPLAAICCLQSLSRSYLRCRTTLPQFHGKLPNRPCHGTREPYRPRAVVG